MVKRLFFFFWPLCCLSFFFWPLYCLSFFLLTIVLSVLLRCTASDYLFGIFKLLTITLSVLLWFTSSDYLFGIFKLLTITLSVLLWFTASDYLFGIFDLRLLITSLVSLIYGFWLPLWYLQTFNHSKSKDRQCNGKKLEDTKGVIRSRK
jgi:hypothetical protein